MRGARCAAAACLTARHLSGAGARSVARHRAALALLRAHVRTAGSRTARVSSRAAFAINNIEKLTAKDGENLSAAMNLAGLVIGATKLAFFVCPATRAPAQPGLTGAAPRAAAMGPAALIEMKILQTLKKTARSLSPPSRERGGAGSVRRVRTGAQRKTQAQAPPRAAHVRR